LTRYPEEQAKIYEEIDEYYGDSMVLSRFQCFFYLISSFLNYFLKIEPNSENIAELKYLEMFVKEVLRFYPIANP
jgi:cytochrome P450